VGAYAELAGRFGLKACWSSPILSRNGGVLGTFALYPATASQPTEDHLEQVALATDMAAIAITRHREESALRRSEARFRQLFEVAPMPLALVDDNGVVLDINRSFTDILGYTRADVPELEPGGAWPIPILSIGIGHKRPGARRCARPARTSVPWSLGSSASPAAPARYGR
jgi:PAS domain-containing protein